MEKPTASWDNIGDRFYRKIPLYTDIFDPDLELENYIVSGAPYSGAIALHRDQSKIQAYRSADANRSTIDLYSCSGHLIKQINWDKGRIVGLGWSDEETLIVVSRDGTVRCYHGLSDDFTPFSLGAEAEEHGVVSVRFWLSGLVALLSNNALIAVSRYDEPRPKLLGTPPTEEILAWALIPPAYSLSRSVEVLLSVGESIYVVDAADADERIAHKGPFHHLAVSPNGRFVALYTAAGRVWVVSADFQEQLSEYAATPRTPPRALAWCGNDAVALAWEDEVHLLGPQGAAAKYYYDGWVALLPDVDGLRLLTTDACEFLHKVPDASEDVFRPGSRAPPALLLDAAGHLAARSPKADDALQLLGARLDDAVEGCIAAAGAEFAPAWQKQLLTAASLGKAAAASYYDSDDFVAMCGAVRVLNAVRSSAVGLPLSLEQYARLTPERLITRLVSRAQFALAERIAESLRISAAPIAGAWARRKVHSSSGDDDATAAQITARLAAHPGASLESVARAAADEGRPRLATQLLASAPATRDTVSLLLGMGEDDRALDLALEGGDTDLTLHVLLQLRRKLPLASFFRAINSRPVASALVETTAREQDADLLKDLYYQDDRRRDGALLLFAGALGTSSVDERISRIQPAVKLVGDAKELAGTAGQISDAAKLLKRQQALDADERLVSADSGAARPQLAGMSLHATIGALLRIGAGKQATALMSEFKVPERVGWWVRLRAYVAARAWREVEGLGKNRRSPIGWEPFVTECLNAGNARLAGSFVARCTGLQARERMELYVKCDLLAKAGEEAVRVKDRAWLEDMREKVGGRERVEIERCIGLLGKK